MPAHTERPGAFPASYTRRLERGILASEHFAPHTLNRDFVGTRGFSLAFRAEAQSELEREFPYFEPFLQQTVRPEFNAYYLNPLALSLGSRVDPHVDRSLRSYCKDVLPPRSVSVLYVSVDPELRGGDLVLCRGKRHLARIRPRTGTLVVFEGDLTHSIERVDSAGTRLSLVCECYALAPRELERIPRLALETRARRYA
jgi:hypothetical protein